jgi:hypothetical protein
MLATPPKGRSYHIALKEKTRREKDLAARPLLRHALEESCQNRRPNKKSPISRSGFYL